MSEWAQTTVAQILKRPIRHGLYKPLNSFGTGTRVLKMGLQFSEDKIGMQRRIPNNR